jgi:regulatory protein
VMQKCIVAVFLYWELARKMAQITALKYQKKNPDRVNVYLDGRFGFGLSAILAATLKPGQVLSDAEIELLKEQDGAEVAYNRALNYLSYRPRSRAEIVRHLERHGVPADRIEAATHRLERAGLLDDEAFARSWVENRERFRPRGLGALRYELRNKGIGDEIVDEVLAAVDVSASAYEAAIKKAHQWSHLDRPTFQRKLMDYLARRGFDYEVAQEVALRCWEELKGKERA